MDDDVRAVVGRLQQRSDDHESDIRRVEKRLEDDIRAFGEEVGKNLVLEVKFNALSESFDQFKRSYEARLDKAERAQTEGRRWKVTTLISVGALLFMCLGLVASILALVVA